jgi:hypothetical protein
MISVCLLNCQLRKSKSISYMLIKIYLYYGISGVFRPCRRKIRLIEDNAKCRHLKKVDL